MRVYDTYIGLSFNVKADKCCVFCKHCIDVVFDYNGPYLILCELGNNTSTHNADNKCIDFEEGYDKND